MVKNLPLIQETWVWSLGQEDPLEKGMTTHSSILAWETHGQRSLAGCGQQGRKESNTTEWLTLFRVRSVVVVFFFFSPMSLFPWGLRFEEMFSLLFFMAYGYFFSHLSESHYTAAQAVYPQPVSCCRVCCLAWPVFFTLELQAVHASVNPCISFQDSDVSKALPQVVFSSSPVWLIASHQQLDLPSVCPILGTDATIHLRDMMFFSCSPMLYLVYQ